MQDLEIRSKVVDNKIDIKELSLYAFSEGIAGVRSGDITTLKLDEGSRVLLYVPFGIFECDIILGKDEGAAFDYLHDFVLPVRNGFIREAEERIGPENSNIVNGSEILHLKDVIFMPYAHPGTRTEMSRMYVFSDQIIGFSIGKLNK